jgi:hypothetical protein
MVKLAVSRQRQLVEDHDRRRHHVVWQSLSQAFAQRSAIQVCAYNVRNETLLRTFVASSDYNRLPHPVLLPQRSFSLPDFDPETAYLHLLIAAPEELKTPVRPPPR